MVKEFDPSKLKAYNIEEITESLKKRFPIEKTTEEYVSVFTKEIPLVTIIINTYNKGSVLVNYSLKSVLDQTYKNLQIIVTSDHSTDDTDILMSTITDSRVSYTNLPSRSDKGVDIPTRWAQAGCVPTNYGFEQVDGDFVAHHDDDDYMIPTKIESLVRFIQAKKVDFVHHPFWLGTLGKIQSINNSAKCERNHVTNSGMFYHSWFSQLPGDPHCHEKFGEPGDWNWIRKVIEIGASVDRYPDPLLIKSYGDIERGTFKG